MNDEHLLVQPPQTPPPPQPPIPHIPKDVIFPQHPGTPGRDDKPGVELGEGAPALVGIHGNLHGSGTNSFTVFPSSANSR